MTAVVLRPEPPELAGRALTGRTTGAVGPAPVAAVQDLRVSFRRNGQVVQALRGLTLDIGPGEVLGLVGESGQARAS